MAKEPTNTQQYTVLHGAVGTHLAGATITAADLPDGADIDRLLRLGAIAPVDAPVEGTARGAGNPPSDVTTGNPASKVQQQVTARPSRPARPRPIPTIPRDRPCSPMTSRR